MKKSLWINFLFLVCFYEFNPIFCTSNEENIDKKQIQVVSIQSLQTTNNNGDTNTVISTFGTGQQPQVIHTNQPFNIGLLPGFGNLGRKKRAAPKDTQTVTIQSAQTINGNGDTPVTNTVITTFGTGQQPQVIHTNQPINIGALPGFAPLPGFGFGRKKRAAPKDTQTVTIQSAQTINGNGNTPVTNTVITTFGTGQQPQVIHTNQPINIGALPGFAALPGFGFGRKKRAAPKDTQTVTIQSAQTTNNNGDTPVTNTVITTFGTGQQPQVIHTNQPINIGALPGFAPLPGFGFGRKKREAALPAEISDLTRQKRQYSKAGQGVSIQSTQVSNGGNPITNTVFSSFGTGQRPTVIHSNQPINFGSLPGFGAGFPNLFASPHNRPTGLDTRFPEVSGSSNSPGNSPGFGFPGFFGFGTPPLFAGFPFGGVAAAPFPSNGIFSSNQYSPPYTTVRPTTTRYTTRSTTRYTTTTRPTTRYTTTRRQKRAADVPATVMQQQDVKLPNLVQAIKDDRINFATSPSKLEIEIDEEEVPVGYSTFCLYHFCG